MDATFPPLPSAGIPTGDMPGDKVHIDASHVAKATAISGRLMELLDAALGANPHHRAVISVHGGSGVGKSEIGSLLAFFLNSRGIGAYVLSGDNYPRRIPAANDAERLRVFRVGGLRGLLSSGRYDRAAAQELVALAADERDSDLALAAERRWLAFLGPTH